MRYEWATGSFAEDDKAQILDILNAVAATEGTNGIPRPLTPEEGAAFMRAAEGSIARGDTHQLLARDEEGRVAAFATLEPVKMNPARKHVVEIKRMAAHPESRGFGHYLLGGWSVLLAKCRELGCDTILIDVSEDGPYRLWEKLGFRVWAKVPDYARVGTRRLDGYYLSVYVDDASAILERFDRSAKVAETAS